MRESLIALLVGFAFGAVCRIAGVPIPAPGALAGVVAIFGVWLGFFVLGGQL